MNKVSVVITGRNRTRLLERTLMAMCYWQTFPKAQVELVFVDDQSDDPVELKRVLEGFRRFFYKVTLVHMDKRLSEVPPGTTCCPSLGMNIAVKQAENEIIYKTDPEGLPLTETVKFALWMFDPGMMWFATCRILTEKETGLFQDVGEMHPDLINESKLVQLPDLWYITEHKRLPYWFGTIFSRSLYMHVGGIDEEFMRGYAGEDDDLAERMQRAGVRWMWSDRFKMVHQFHGHEDKRWIHTAQHEKNIARLRNSREEARVQANVGRDWGAEKVVLAREVF